MSPSPMKETPKTKNSYLKKQILPPHFHIKPLTLHLDFL